MLKLRENRIGSALFGMTTVLCLWTTLTTPFKAPVPMPPRVMRTLADPPDPEDDPPPEGYSSSSVRGSGSPPKYRSSAALNAPLSDAA